jgi:hypothetical protein
MTEKKKKKKKKKKRNKMMMMMIPALQTREWDGSVGMVDWATEESRWCSWRSVPTDCGVRLVFCAVRTGCPFLGCKADRA